MQTLFKEDRYMMLINTYFATLYYKKPLGINYAL